MTYTDQEKAAKLAALVEERRGLESRLVGAREAGDAAVVATLDARVAAVDEQIAFWGGGAAPKAKRAEKRGRK